MNLETVMNELESLATDNTKKRYIGQGAREPLFGVPTGKMKPMRKEIKTDQALAEELYATGNFDAMYFAGVIADPDGMTEADYDRWMEDAYFHMLSDMVVAVTLSEAKIAQQVADKWIHSGDELYMSAGWSCYCWLLGSQQDDQFSEAKLSGMLDFVLETIHEAPERAKASMNNFVYTVGLSYLPLHDKAKAVAEAIGEVEIIRENKKNQILNAYQSLAKEVDRDRIGFKRKYVRC